MHERCSKSSSKSFKDYGGRGIRVCDAWNEFTVFRDWAVSNGYSDELTIDRINSNGNYEPANCRWATRTEQNNNKRNTPWITVHGQTMSLASAARRFGINHGTLVGRLGRGWPPEQAVEPVVN